MSFIHHPIIINYEPEELLEDHCKSVIQFSPLSVTWLAYDQSAAKVATATLIAKGYKAQSFAVPKGIKDDWHVQALFH